MFFLDRLFHSNFRLAYLNFVRKSSKEFRYQYFKCSTSKSITLFILGSSLYLSCSDSQVPRYRPFDLDKEDPVLRPEDVDIDPEITLDNVECKTVKELQIWLRLRGCHVGGAKEDLIKRCVLPFSATYFVFEVGRDITMLINETFTKH